MLKNKVLFLFVIILIHINTVIAQEFNLKSYNVKDGLAHSQVSVIFQDSKSYIWFATYGGGISKFDGHSFKNYTITEGLASNVLRSVCEDNDGNIWVGTLGSGISVIKNDTIISIDTTGSGMDSFIYALVNDSVNNTIWIGTGLGIFTYKDGVLSSFSEEKNLPVVPIMNIFKDSKNRMWFTLWEKGLYYLDNGELNHIDTTLGLTHNTAFIVKEDEKGSIWVGTFEGLDKIVFHENNSVTIESFETFDKLKAMFVSGLEFDNKGNLWIGYNGKGVVKYNPKNNEKVLINGNNGLTSDVAYFILKDKENNIWISTWGTGVSKYSGDRFVSYNKYSGIETNIVKSIFIDSSDFFVLTSKLYRKEKNKFYRFMPEKLKGREFISLFKDSKSRLWLGESKKLISIENGRIKEYKSDESEFEYLTFIKSISEDNAGTIWFGTWGNGLSYLKDNKFTHVDFLPIKRAFVNTIKNFNNVLWVGTASGVAYKKGDDWNYFQLDSLSEKSLVYSIEMDKNGDLWIAAFGQGLFRVINPSDSINREIQKFDSKDLLIDVSVTGVKFDNNFHYLWLSSAQGLDRLDIESFKKNGDFKLRHYDNLDGFIESEVNSNAIAVDLNNNIWFGTKSGLIKYNPKSDEINEIEPQTYITDLRLFYKKIDWSKLGYENLNNNGLPLNLVLNYKQNHISFSFVAINTTSPKKVKYKYYLKGAETDWSPITSRSEVTYSSLPYGEYTFMLKATNNDGIWNKNAVTYSFVIKPPFYKTWLFYIIVGLLVFLMFFTYLKLRTRKLKKDKQILEGKVKQRTIEIEQQKEEIQVQNENLQQQNEEILTQRDEIEHQKEVVEYVHKQLSESIDYATSLQQSILPDDKLLKKYLTEHFVLFMPKDKVSGDFYWWTHIENRTIITAADCTGHGVPGAFMSMLGISFLREIVQKEYITHTGVILRKLRKEIIKALGQTGEMGEQQDGMDMAIVSINHETNVVQFSGANNPLYIITNDELRILNEESARAVKLCDNSKLRIQNLPAGRQGSKLLYEVKPDKMPIAIYAKMNKFNSYEIQLEKGDQLYMFSDGFADQFGGNKGKKFKYKPFKKILLENSHKPMIEQELILKNVFLDWKGSYSQIDDVVVLGIKI